MDASQYKNYILTLLFVKYVSDKYAGQKHGAIIVPEGGSFGDMVALKGQNYESVINQDWHSISIFSKNSPESSLNKARCSISQDGGGNPNNRCYSNKHPPSFNLNRHM